jgi:hypothetical protein
MNAVVTRTHGFEGVFCSNSGVILFDMNIKQFAVDAGVADLDGLAADLAVFYIAL